MCFDLACHGRLCYTVLHKVQTHATTVPPPLSRCFAFEENNNVLRFDSKRYLYILKVEVSMLDAKREPDNVNDARHTAFNVRDFELHSSCKVHHRFFCCLYCNFCAENV